MAYQVIIPAKVQKELNKIPVNYHRKITAALVVLSNNPYSGKKLKGERKGEWSLIVWPYRIIYRIKKYQLIVLIVKIGHRQGIY
jgi:mRNA interferase RelE/StbE